MLFMVIEEFRAGEPSAVYKRLRERGRLIPDGVRYVDSWVAADLSRCFQVMDCNDRQSLDNWIERWSDLVRFEVHPVITSLEAAARFG